MQLHYKRLPIESFLLLYVFIQLFLVFHVCEFNIIGYVKYEEASRDTESSSRKWVKNLRLGLLIVRPKEKKHHVLSKPTIT